MDSDGLARLMAELRPRLHRYCTRMVGSAFEGEDVVQDALASDPNVSSADIAYVILLDWVEDRIVAIRDFRYAPYVVDSLAVQIL